MGRGLEKNLQVFKSSKKTVSLSPYSLTVDKERSVVELQLKRSILSLFYNLSLFTLRLKSY